MFREISPEELVGNPFSMIGKEWMLLTARREDGGFNCMTASWGGLGILWNKPVMYCFIRPQRYTHEFSEAGERMSAAFFSEDYRRALALCGRVSGRDTDKITDAGLHPYLDGEDILYREARVVLCGRKIYRGRIEPDGFFGDAGPSQYPKKDYHTVYVYEIERVLVTD